MSRNEHRDPSVHSSADSASTNMDATNATQCNKQKFGKVAAAPNQSTHRNLSQKQLAAIDLLLQGTSDAEAAEALNLDRTTVYRWRALHTPFRLELQRQRRQLFQHTTDRLRSLLHPALDSLHRILTDPDTDPRLTLRAAAVLLRLTTPSRRHLAPSPLNSTNKEDLDDILEATLATEPTQDELDVRAE